MDIAGNGYYFRFSGCGPLNRWKVGDIVRLPEFRGMYRHRPEWLVRVVGLDEDGLARFTRVDERGRDLTLDGRLVEDE